jgi:quinol monooxygenase YgiN
MAIIRVHTPDEYITLINLFTVRPEDQLGLTRVQLGDIYWYGKRQPGALSANFHRSLDGVRFFNYAQWRSIEALTRARETPEFKAHIGNYRYFEMSSDPGLYEVVRTTGGRPLAIRWPSRLTVTLRVLSIRPDDQAEALRIVEEGLQALEQAAGLVGAALHRGLDGGRVAVYAQWCDEAAIDAAITLPGYQAAEGALAAIEHTSDLRVYEIAGTSEDLSPAPPGR